VPVLLVVVFVVLGAVWLVASGDDDGGAEPGLAAPGSVSTAPGASTRPTAASGGGKSAADDPALVAPEPDAPGTVYLALGDSLAQGVQKLRGRYRTTDQGYPDALAARLRRSGTPVRLARVGCSGATARSLLQAGWTCDPPTPAPLPYADDGPATSQLAWAEGWLRRRGDRPTLVTLDVGANDLLGCATPDADRVRACFAERLPTVERRLAEAARRLRAAAGSRTVLAAITYYDPAVALVRIGATRDAAVAFHDAVRRRANPAILRIFGAEGFVVGRVDRAFGSDRPATEAGVVDTTCRLTRLCTQADFHPTAAGYARIADALAGVVAGPVARAAAP
jgi:lysophospholipase L1-like esterase